MSDDPIYVRQLGDLVQPCKEQHPDVPWLSVAEYLRRSQDESWQIIDCRPPGERRVSILPGSISLLQFRFQRARHEGKQLLLYCTVGCRSGAHVRRFRKRGLPAHNLWGGVLAWAEAGQPFVTPHGQSTRRVHVHGRRPDVLPPEYEATSGQ